MRKTLASYGIAIVAAVVSFLLVINVRAIVIMIYRMALASQGRISWNEAAINAIIMIILLSAWLFYVFFIQNHFEKKVKTREQYIKGSLTLLLPIIVVYIATAIYFLIMMP